MTTDVAVRGEVQPAGLDGLADIANREHASAEKMMSTALSHAIRSGLALLRVRESVASGEWIGWLEQNFHGSRDRACVYMRIAWHRNALSEEMSIVAAQEALRGKPGPVPHGSNGRGLNTRPRLDEHTFVEIRALHEQGLSAPAIAAAIGVSTNTVYRTVVPGYAEKVMEQSRRANRRAREKKNEQMRAERQRKLEAAIKRKAGTSIADSYSNLRKLAASLDAASTDAQSRAHKERIGRALAALYRIEDDLRFCLGADD